MSLPLISIITVVYNGASTIGQTIRSVAEQSYAPIEYIVVDGGSTDDTIGIVKSSGDTITKWVSEPDKGIYDAMNKGIRMATGEWVYFLGSDDVFNNKDVLTSFFANGAADEADVVYGDVVLAGTKAPYDGPFDLEKLLSRNLSHQAAFYRRSLFGRLGDFDLKYRMHADWDFNIRCFSDPAVRCRYTGVLVADFGPGGFSASMRHDLPFLREKLIPAKLRLLEEKGLRTLRRPVLYDEWWRSLRNADLRDSREPVIRHIPAPGFPGPLESMLRWQQMVPASFLRNGFFSKGWMFTSYLINRLTGKI